jgi:hypothetical protein
MDGRNLPGLLLPVGIQYKSKCDDQSALETAGLGHLTATLVEHYQISFDYAIDTHNSNLQQQTGFTRKNLFRNRLWLNYRD